MGTELDIVEQMQHLQQIRSKNGVGIIFFIYYHQICNNYRDIFLNQCFMSVFLILT